MTICKKCKEKIGIFSEKSVCTDCDATYCTKCKTEIVSCEYCDADYCKKCLVEHLPDCKESMEDEEVNAEDDDTEDPEGITFNKGKTVCILDLSNYNISNYINELETLKKDFILDEYLSSDDYMVWFKKV
jgi:hypothetical protein